MAYQPNRLRTDGLSHRKPYAQATLDASSLAPGVSGRVRFYAAPGGTMVEAALTGLPAMSQPTATPQVGPFGFHIHEGTICVDPTGSTPFAAAGGHYNPTNQPHPLHAGDLPVIFPNDGRGYMRMYTNRFTPADVVGRTVVLHQMPDDFRTQPAGDSGMRIGCGAIRRA
ncbi:MAG: superoxide dismutase family protein [Oscillospiraceae bacterium]|jgi:Cu-Zn family superoxide dismutase|nr:superoxide dismutase family protein [Oscillospiraceae bacterium]